MSTSESLTEKIEDSNLSYLKDQIEKKKCSDPYYGTINHASDIVTDIDHYPYTRFYRGEYKSNQPIAMEREAGWRPQRNSCYSMNKIPERSPYPNHCFESACSTVYPCYPPYLSKYSDRNALNVQLNRSCIVQYR